MTTAVGRPRTAARIAVALDTADEGRLVDLAAALAGEADVLKVGLQAVTAFGPRAIRRVAEHAPVFCDLKLHDIPNTVAGAAAAAAAAGASMLTVHAAGGAAMVAAAVAAAPAVDILAVTVLTSVDDVLLAELGMDGADVVAPRLARHAVTAGAAGIVCAGHEVSTVRNVVGNAALVVVPGIRPEGAAVQDQARVMTPRAAVDAGADLLVIGRPVTAADDPVAALRTVRTQLAATPSADET
ncbi:MAG: orotidine-5'-phosphate decarboxylase [Actinobacteria bacterium]|nr:orotidine-5'-phosphate decarboxylase [Actinomycetota bacterium]